MSTDQVIEQEIQAKGLDKAPRVTPADIEAAIVAEMYLTPAEALGRGALHVHQVEHMDLVNISLNLLSVCVLVLRNGYTVVGTSACASPENFNEEFGRKLARQKAIDQVWPLMGYALRERLAG